MHTVQSLVLRVCFEIVTKSFVLRECHTNMTLDGVIFRDLEIIRASMRTETPFSLRGKEWECLLVLREHCEAFP